MHLCTYVPVLSVLHTWIAFLPVTLATNKDADDNDNYSDEKRTDAQHARQQSA